jgi:7-cyano-7-deazaguanine synthase in queuosine biosynthesis
MKILSPKKKVLLLLSGGRDSAAALEILLKNHFEPVGLCISGLQKKEVIGAKSAEEKFNIELIVTELFFFDEETWNPIKLIFRDLAMGAVAIYLCRKNNIRYLATGVKENDLNNNKLKWLNGFLKFSKFVLIFFGIELVYPLIDMSFSQSPDCQK